MLQVQKILSEKYMSCGLDKMTSDVIEILKWIAFSNNSCWADNNGAARAINNIRKKSEEISKLDEIMRCFGYRAYRSGICTTYHIDSISRDLFRQLPSFNDSFNDTFVREIETNSFRSIVSEGNCSHRARVILKSLYRYFTSVDGNDYSDLDKMSDRRSMTFVESPR